MTEVERLRRLLAPSPASPISWEAPGQSPSELSPARLSPSISTIAVCSGKGGVGKSTVSVNLAAALTKMGYQVGLLDADVHSPDIPLMVGLKRSVASAGWTLSRAGGLDKTPLKPVRRYGVKIMSSGFIVAEDQAITWTAGLVSVLLNQLVFSTHWGSLDYLVVDLPPGTSDVMQAVFRMVPDARAVIVVTPQDVAHLDNRRVLTALRAMGVDMLGGIENMSGLRCPCCSTQLEVFPPVAHDRSIWGNGAFKLGTIPFGVRLEGVNVTEPIVVTALDSARGQALYAVAEAVRDAVNRRRDDRPA